MTNFVLVHSIYQGGWIWQHVASRLRAAGHTVYAPTLDGCASAGISCAPASILDLRSPPKSPNCYFMKT